MSYAKREVEKELILADEVKTARASIEALSISWTIRKSQIYDLLKLIVTENTRGYQIETQMSMNMGKIVWTKLDCKLCNKDCSDINRGFIHDLNNKRSLSRDLIVTEIPETVR